MPAFSYKAIDQFGRTAQGRLDAGNEIDLEARLARIGLDLLAFRPARERPGIWPRQQVGLQELAMLCFQLEQLTQAGVPLLDGLADLRDSAASPHLQRLIEALAAEVESGQLLSEALAGQPAVFDHVFVSLVRAGEQAGKLPDVFAKLAAALKWRDALSGQIRRMMLYPLFVLCVVLAAVIFLMTYLVPQMAILLASLGQPLPLETRLLIAASRFLVDYWGWLATSTLLLALAAAALIRQSATMRHRLDSLKLRLPILGGLMHKLILARFAGCFALMYEAGIPILDALKSCEGIVGNRVLAAALDQVHQQINAGSGLGESFRNAGLFPPLVVRMIHVGEQTGSLDRALRNIGYFYDREVSEAVEKMLKLLEPLLTVILGLILAGIMLAVLGPVYDTLSQLKI